MAQKHVINVDLADVWADKDRKNLLRTLAWGDEVAVIRQTSNHVEVSLATCVGLREPCVATKREAEQGPVRDPR